MKVERLEEDRILIQFYDKGEEVVISDNMAEELASNLNLIKFCGPLNNVVENGCACTEPRTFRGNGIVIICNECGLPVVDRRTT